MFADSRLRVLVLLLCLGAVPVGAAAAAQAAGRLTGRVIHSLTLEPLAGAVVTISELKREQTSAADGTYAFDGLPPGEYHLTVRLAGFLAARQEVSVTVAGATLEVPLDPELHFTDVVSVTAGARDPFEAFQPTSVLSGQDLTKQIQGTLGATLEQEPGVATRSFGAGSARPVIRGLDGDRVLILTDGQRMGDLSSQSADHGVTVNPASASRIEIVRGPATLLYGANAIGGLVNVITDEIPTRPLRGTSGAFTVDGGSSAVEAGAAGGLSVGNGRLALHVGGSGRRAGDYGTPQGDVPNSFTRGGAVQVGLSATGSRGYVGGSFAYDRTHYGVPLVEEGETNLTPGRHTVNLRAERRELPGLLSGLRGSFGYRRYRHDERDGEAVVTNFRNDTAEFEMLGSQRPIGRLTGSLGAWVMTRRFVSAGEEALAPPTDQRGFALFAYEELGGEHLTFQFGARVERASFTPDADLPARAFTNLSGSAGLLARPTEGTTLAISLARASRNPALEELYNNGPHAGNFAFEIGDPTLESEHALGFDVAFRWRQPRVTGEVSYFLNDISHFIYRRLTGEVGDDLPVTYFAAGDSRLQGVESHVDVRVLGALYVEGGVDYVRGELTTTGEALPRMPPLRGRIGLRYQRDAFQAGGDLLIVGRQDRIQGLETPTDGYNLLKLFATYGFTDASGRVLHTVTARLDNVTDAEYRNHLSYLKDLTSEMGRNLKILYEVRF